MGKAEQFRAHARHIRALGADAISSDRQRAFEELAEYWERLAEAAEKEPPPQAAGPPDAA